jgi:hypothetical protein
VSRSSELRTARALGASGETPRAIVIYFTSKNGRRT